MTMPKKSARKAFVIMPFKDPFDSYYQAIFLPALEAAGYDVARGDDMFTPQPIMLDIQNSIRDSNLVLCEMSGRNPNVFYELGLAHAIGKPTILVTRKEEDIPFDLRHIRAIVYDYTRAGWEAKLLRDITSAARSLDESKETWPPPLIKASPGSNADTGADKQAEVFPPAVNRPINLRFDGPLVGNRPFGWFNSVGFVDRVSPYFESKVVQRAGNGGGVCVRFENPRQTQDEFGSLMQACPADYLANRTIRFEGEIRTENVSGWCALWFRADGNSSPNLFFDNMSRRPVRGTTDWATYSIEAQLPLETTWINYGFLLSGAGTMFVANLRLQAWDTGGRWLDV